MLTSIYILHWIIDDFFSLFVADVLIFIIIWLNSQIFFLFFQKHLYSFDIFFSHYKNTLQASKFYIRWSISLFCGGAFYYFLTTFVTEFPFFFFLWGEKFYIDLYTVFHVNFRFWLILYSKSWFFFILN